MYGFQFKDVTYGQEAAGWVDGVYYPRTPRINDGSSFLEEEQDGWRLHSRVWQEIEETGYGIYYYEGHRRAQ